jgi:hypothetical protein
MTKSSAQQLPPYPSDTVYWASLALAVGSLGVVVTSVFYALSPVPAALPIPTPQLAQALSGTLAGRTTLLAAGTVGIISDVIFAAGALLLMAFRHPAGWPIERVGWALATMSVLIFIGVDALAAGVLTQLAALDGAGAAFAGFKLLFDILFILGTLTTGLGVPAILVSELKADAPVLARPLIWLGLLAAGAGLVGGLLYFVNVSLPQVIGISIAGVSLIFAIYGVQIARSARSPAGR